MSVLLRAAKRFPVLLALLIALGSAAQAGASETVLLQGPVEGVDFRFSRVKIAGQSVAVTSNVLRQVRKGDHAAIVGYLGGFSTRFVRTSAPYVPGSSIVVVTGVVTECLPAVAKVRVGGVWVDYSQVLSASPELSPRKGDVVVSTGVQPLMGGTILAASTEVLGGATVSVLIGTSIQSEEVVRFDEPVTIAYGGFVPINSKMGGIIGGGSPSPGPRPLIRNDDPDPTETAAQ